MKKKINIKFLNLYSLCYSVTPVLPVSNEYSIIDQLTNLIEWYVRTRLLYIWWIR